MIETRPCSSFIVVSARRRRDLPDEKTTMRLSSHQTCFENSRRACDDVTHCLHVDYVALFRNNNQMKELSSKLSSGERMCSLLGLFLFLILTDLPNRINLTLGNVYHFSTDHCTESSKHFPLEKKSIIFLLEFLCLRNWIFTSGKEKIVFCSK